MKKEFLTKVFKNKKYITLLIITTTSIIFDQITKYLIVRFVNYREDIDIIKNFLTITYVHNKGAAFSLFSGLNAYFFLIVALIAILFIFYFFLKLEENQKHLYIGFSLILGGALGNIIDRIRLKYVIDFIDIHWYDLHWPAFNVADILITSGIIILIIDAFITSKKERKNKTN